MKKKCLRKMLLAWIVALAVTVDSGAFVVLAEETSPDSEMSESIQREEEADTLEGVWQEEETEEETAEASGDGQAERMLLVLEDGVSEKEIEKAIEKEKIDTEEVAEIGEGIATVSLEDEMSVDEAQEALEAVDGVVSAEPDVVREYDGYTNDPEISSAKYASNLNKYHYIFKLGLAGPGKTA